MRGRVKERGKLERGREKEKKKGERMITSPAISNNAANRVCSILGYRCPDFMGYVFIDKSPPI